MYKLSTLFTLILYVLPVHFIKAQDQQQQQQYIFKQEQQNYGMISPFTYEWTQLLENYHNTLGSNRNLTKDDSACLYPTPAFHCKPFIWHDAIIDRDAYHLRPSVSREVFS